MKFTQLTMMAVGLLAYSSFAVEGVWQGVSGGKWSTPENWVGGVVPNAENDIADFSRVAGSTTVLMDMDVAVRRLVGPSAGKTLTISGEGRTLKLLSYSAYYEVFAAGNSTVRLQGVTLTSQGLLGNVYRKVGAGKLETYGAHQAQTIQAVGGTLEVGLQPLVHYAFDDEANLGKDSGLLGKDLTHNAGESENMKALYRENGKFGGCAFFNWTRMWADSAEGLPGGKSSFTVSMWIKNVLPAQWHRLWSWGLCKNWNGSNRAVLSAGDFSHGFNSNDDLTMNYREGQAGNKICRTDVWTHLVLTSFTNGDRVIYLDGEEVVRRANNNLQNVVTDSYFAIGALTGADGRTLDGILYCYLDDFMIFDCGMSAADVQRLYRSSGSFAAAPIAETTVVKTGMGGEFSVRGGYEQKLAALTGAGDVRIDANSSVALAPTSDATNSIGRLLGDGKIVNEGAGTLEIRRAAGLSGQIEIKAGKVVVKGGGIAANDPRLVAYWKFDDPSDVGKDSGPNGMTLTPQSGTFDGMLDLGGKSIHVNQSVPLVLADSAKHVFLPSGKSDYTVALWVRSGYYNNGEPIYTWGVINAAHQWCARNRLQFRWGDGKMTMQHSHNAADDWTFYAAGTDDETANMKAWDYSTDGTHTAPRSPDGWHHLAISVGQTVRKVFFDGRLVASSDNAKAANRDVVAEDFKLGTYSGDYDDVMIFNAALSDEEMAMLPAGLGDTQGVRIEQSASTTLEVASGLFRTAGGSFAGAVTGDGELSLSGNVELSATSALTPAALSLAEGAVLTYKGAPAVSAPVSVTAAMALPAQATIVFDLTETTAEGEYPLFASAGGLTGSTEGWTSVVKVDGAVKTSWKVEFVKTGTGLSASVHRPGMLLIIR